MMFSLDDIIPHLALKLKIVDNNLRRKFSFFELNTNLLRTSVDNIVNKNETKIFFGVGQGSTVYGGS